MIEMVIWRRRCDRGVRVPGFKTGTGHWTELFAGQRNGKKNPGRARGV